VTRAREIDQQGGQASGVGVEETMIEVTAPMGAVPALGEHTDTVLAELGFGAEEIARLREKDVTRLA